MKQQVLKALANPAHIFYVPYTLAVLNFVIQFLIWVAVFVVTLLIPGIDPFSPLYFLLSVILVHTILAGFAKKEPQLGQIIMAKIRLFKQKIPRRLVS